MSEEKLWTTWRTRWKFTEKNAINIVKEIFRLGGTQLVEKREIEKLIIYEDGLDFAIELGWLKDCYNDTYKLTCSGLLMLSHQIKT